MALPHTRTEDKSATMCSCVSTKVQTLFRLCGFISFGLCFGVASKHSLNSTPGFCNSAVPAVPAFTPLVWISLPQHEAY